MIHYTVIVTFIVVSESQGAMYMYCENSKNQTHLYKYTDYYI